MEIPSRAALPEEGNYWTSTKSTGWQWFCIGFNVALGVLCAVTLVEVLHLLAWSVLFSHAVEWSFAGHRLN